MKLLPLLLAALATVVFSLGSIADLPPEHFIATYVPWGTDEFELFDLTQPQLEKRFDGKLNFETVDKITHAEFSNSGRGPQFLITFSNGKVSTVQRLFIDGAGCNIKGPILKTKKDALQFSIDGLTKLKSTDPKDKEKLIEAQKTSSNSKRGFFRFRQKTLVLFDRLFTSRSRAALCTFINTCPVSSKLRSSAEMKQIKEIAGAKDEHR